MSVAGRVFPLWSLKKRIPLNSLSSFPNRSLTQTFRETSRFLSPRIGALTYSLPKVGIIQSPRMFSAKFLAPETKKDGVDFSKVKIGDREQDDTESDEVPIQARQTLKERFKSYGKVGLIVYLCISLTVFTITFLTISVFGDEGPKKIIKFIKDHVPLLHRNGSNYEEKSHGGIVSKVMSPFKSYFDGETFSIIMTRIILATAISKLFTPLKLVIAALITPIIMRYGRSRGYKWAFIKSTEVGTGSREFVNNGDFTKLKMEDTPDITKRRDINPIK